MARTQANDIPPATPPAKRRRVWPKSFELENAIRIAQRVGTGNPILTPVDAFVQVRDAVMERVQSEPELELVGKDLASLDKCVVFWAKVFGREGAQRLSSLLELVRAVTAWDGPALPSRIEQPAPPPPGPESVRRFVAAYQLQARERSTAVVAKCLRHLHIANFYREYQALLTDANTEDSDMRHVFKKHDMTTARGRSWASLVTDYLVFCLDGVSPHDFTSSQAKASRNRLKNDLQQGHPYYLTETIFGPGIFVLLPDHDHSVFVHPSLSLSPGCY